MGFSVQTIKQLIYTKLSTDSVLIALLGGNINIFHFYPNQEKNLLYPIVVYSILAITDNPYDADRNADINSFVFNIDVFSDNSSMKEADDIADRIYALFHGKNLSNTDVVAYTCYRQYQDETYEADGRVWRINARYNLTNSGK